MNAPDKISYAEALAELVHLSGWSKADVVAKPHDAYWVASGVLARCRRIIEDGEKR